MSDSRHFRPEVSDPSEIMDDLVFSAELRFGEAINKQRQDPYSVWFTRGADAETGEQIAWYRLGESTELAKRGLEILDIGIVVIAAAGVVEPEPVVFSPTERHFYVNKPQLERPHLRVAEGNSVRVVQPRRHRRVRQGVDITPIADLSIKLHNYHLQSLRVRHEA